MSTSIHQHQTSRPWDARRSSGTDAPPSAGAVARQVLRAIGAALVPGRAQDDMVPALAASDAQGLLERVGTLDPGHATGRWDRATTDAVARFQRARHLPCTGVLDHRTADALLAGGHRG